MDAESKKILKYIATLEKMKDDIDELINKKIREWNDMSEKAEKESKILDEIYTEKSSIFLVLKKILMGPSAIYII